MLLEIDQQHYMPNGLISSEQWMLLEIDQEHSSEQQMLLEIHQEHSSQQWVKGI